MGEARSTNGRHERIEKHRKPARLAGFFCCSHRPKDALGFVSTLFVVTGVVINVWCASRYGGILRSFPEDANKKNPGVFGDCGFIFWAPDAVLGNAKPRREPRCAVLARCALGATRNPEQWPAPGLIAELLARSPASPMARGRGRSGLGFQGLEKNIPAAMLAK
jgi:hypothetical protein